MASFGDHGVVEGNRISALKSHGQALEQNVVSYYYRAAWNAYEV